MKQEHLRLAHVRSDTRQVVCHHSGVESYLVQGFHNGNRIVVAVILKNLLKLRYSSAHVAEVNIEDLAP